jgi:RNA polymerase sigma-70 factor (ECF subfamily)
MMEKAGRLLSSDAHHADRHAADETLLEGVRAHDQAAMAALFDRYGSMVYSIALRVLGQPSAAEDVMQEVFVQLWQNPRTFVAGRGSLPAWLAVVARNRAVDVLRRRRPTDPVEDVVLAARTNLAEEAERNMMMDRIHAHLGSLPPDQQSSLRLAFFEGLSHAEIAARTGTPLGTVKTRIRTALLSLREAVGV